MGAGGAGARGDGAVGCGDGFILGDGGATGAGAGFAGIAGLACGAGGAIVRGAAGGVIPGFGTARGGSGFAVGAGGAVRNRSVRTPSNRTSAAPRMLTPARWLPAWREADL